VDRDLVSSSHDEAQADRAVTAARWRDIETLHAELADVRSRQGISDETNLAAHADLRADVRRILQRLDERAGAEKFAMMVARVLWIVFGASVAGWFVSHFQLDHLFRATDSVEVR
jgi:hypothetical protein